MERSLPRISVMMLAYNHEAFIERAVNSALMQRVDAPFEVVIFDDCSKDSTPAILQKLAEQHPDVIRLTLQTQNVGVNRNALDAISDCRGEYIAILEGDDYWLHADKLQRQLELLDRDSSAVACHHNVFLESNGDRSSRRGYYATPLGRIDHVSMMSRNWVATCSVLFRRDKLLPLPAHFKTVPSLDWAIHSHLTQFGDYVFIDEVWGVYTQHPGSYWSSQTQRRNLERQLVSARLILQTTSGAAATRMQEVIREWQEDLLVTICTADGAAAAYEYAEASSIEISAGLRHLCEGLSAEGQQQKWRAASCFLQAFCSGTQRRRSAIGFFRVAGGPVFHIARAIKNRLQSPTSIRSGTATTVSTGDETQSGSLNKLRSVLDLDRVVSFSILSRLWPLLAGPITLYLISAKFSQAEQGYYYAIASLLGMQSFFELGLSGVVISLVSHLWSKLGMTQDGFVDGDSDNHAQLASLLRVLSRWYQIISAGFAVGIAIAGYYFLSTRSLNPSEWLLPYLSAVLFTAINLGLVPKLAVLEACGQNVAVFRMRFAQAVVSNIGLWTCIFLDGGLWTLTLTAATQLLFQGYLVGIPYRRFFARLRRYQRESHFDWREKIWPLQWRIAVQSFAAWVGMQAFVPVMFQYHGEIAAGQMGMTWTVLTAIQSLGQAWTQARLPQFGRLIASGQREELDRLMSRTLQGSLAAVVVTAAGFVLLITGLVAFAPRFAARFVDPVTAIVFSGAVVLYQIIVCQATYVRAHNRDPFLVLATASNLLCGGLVWGLGKSYGAIGAASAYAGVVSAILLPFCSWIWSRCRSENAATSASTK